MSDVFSPVRRAISSMGLDVTVLRIVGRVLMSMDKMHHSWVIHMVLPIMPGSLGMAPAVLMNLLLLGVVMAVMLVDHVPWLVFYQPPAAAGLLPCTSEGPGLGNISSEAIKSIR
mmetsp:Transcript_39694/g.61957  ORF Transcript_39694/g.61957 Transcript_39694/m.61957 type:complete len:114 (-) Transcript_39694:326-667(-)